MNAAPPPRGSLPWPCSASAIVSPRSWTSPVWPSGSTSTPWPGCRGSTSSRRRPASYLAPLARPVGSPLRILDIACGGGDVVRRLARYAERTRPRLARRRLRPQPGGGRTRPAARVRREGRGRILRPRRPGGSASGRVRRDHLLAVPAPPGGAAGRPPARTAGGDARRARDLRQRPESEPARAWCWPTPPAGCSRPRPSSTPTGRCRCGRRSPRPRRRRSRRGRACEGVTVRRCWPCRWMLTWRRA